jgi:hypothetical protein
MGGLPDDQQSQIVNLVCTGQSCFVNLGMK